MNAFARVCLFVALSSAASETRRANGNAIVFPETSRKQEIPLDLIRRVNEGDIDSVQDFIENFVDASDANNSTLSVLSRIGAIDVERSAIRSAKMAKCMPELKTVSLSPERDSTVFYYPSCTRVERCGGCCAHRLLSCQPVETEVLQFSVVVAEYRGGNHLRFRDKEIVQVERHKKCKCDCKVRPEDCTRYQRYNEEKCGCECRNVDDERKCYDDRKNRMWNKDVCSCTCKEELECGSGFYFDPFHCSCEPAQSRRKVAKHRPNNWTFDFAREYYNVSTSEDVAGVLFRAT